MPTANGDLLLSFGNRLRELRVSRGISQEEFGYQAGLDRTYVSGLERGVRNPTLAALNQVALALGVELSELLAGVEGGARS